MLDNKCNYPGCTVVCKGSPRVNEILYCLEHHDKILKEMAESYIASLSPGDIAPPGEDARLRYMLRWVEISSGFPDGLSRAKARDRSFQWTFDGSNLEF